MDVLPAERRAAELEALSQSLYSIVAPANRRFGSENPVESRCNKFFQRGLTLSGRDFRSVEQVIGKFNRRLHKTISMVLR